MSIFQYQALAEPVLVDAPAVTVYLDWQAQSNWQPRPRSRRAVLSTQTVQPFSASIITPRVTRSAGNFSHEVSKDDGRSRKALQQMSVTLNALRGSGELQGRFDQSYLGYNPANVQSWGTIAPDSLADALDRIAAALHAAGFTP